MTVAVSVTDGTGGIGNANVKLTDADGNEYTGKTGSAGGCNIQNVPVGTYEVIVTATGYNDYPKSSVEFTEESHSLNIEMTGA